MKMFLAISFLAFSILEAEPPTDSPLWMRMEATGYEDWYMRQELWPFIEPPPQITLPRQPDILAQSLPIGGIPISSGTSVTVHLGGTAQTSSDSGDGLFIIFTPFTTPSPLSSPSWGSSCNFYIVTAAAGNNGCGLYSSTTTTGTVSTSGTTMTSGSALFTSSMVGNAFTAGGYTGTITAFGSSTSVTIANTIGALTSVAFAMTLPNAKLCTAFSTTTPSTGWNALALSGCGAPSAGTIYYNAEIFVSNSVAMGTNTNGTYCPGTNALTTVFTASTISGFTGNASWPATAPTVALPNTMPSPWSNGCYTQYLDISYTTTSQYTIVSLGLVFNAPVASLTANIPATISGHALIVAAVAIADSLTSAPTVTDNSSDTFTKSGACSTNVGSTTQGLCILSTPRATAGTTSITLTPASSSHQMFFYMEVAGTAASSSIDTQEYDSAATTSPFTSGSTGTTAQAVELLIGLASNSFNACHYGVPLFAASGSWTMLATNAVDAGGTCNDRGQALFMQITSATGAYHLTGSELAGGETGSNNILGLAAFK